MNQTWENDKKPSFRPNFAKKFFFKNLAPSVTISHGQLSSCALLDKLMIRSWKNLVTDGQTDRYRDRQRDRQTRVIFIRHYTTNVECPKTDP